MRASSSPVPAFSSPLPSSRYVSIRLFDPDRRPPGWMEIVRPGQYVAFSKTVDTGGSCDPDGVPFADVGQAACLIFKSLDDARTFCEGQVARAPAVRFEIFDST